MSSVSILHYSSHPVIGGVETIIKVLPEMRSLHLVDRDLHRELEEGKVSERFEELKNSIYKKLKVELSSTDLCISHNVLTMHFNLALTSALVKIIEEKYCKKFISWSHDATFTDPNYRKQWRDKYPWSLLRHPAKGGENVTISNSRREKLSNLFKIKPGEITVIPDGISPASFLNLSPLTMRLYERFHLAQFDFIFFYPTRVVRRKNMELAIRITKEVNAKGKSSCLIITGSPDPHNEDSILYYESLRSLMKEVNIEDRVIFLSEERDRGRRIKVGNNLLRDFYLLSDLLLFPSKQEGFGIPVLEAGISHLPVACSSYRAVERSRWGGSALS